MIGFELFIFMIASILTGIIIGVLSTDVYNKWRKLNEKHNKEG